MVKSYRGVEKAKEKNLKVAALYVDLDDFNRITDKRGHKYGDAVFNAASKRMVRGVCDDGMCGRAEAS